MSDTTSTHVLIFVSGYEAGALEDPSIPPPDDMWTRTVDPRAAPDELVDIAILFEQALPVKLRVGNKEYIDSLEIFLALNDIGKRAGIGRIDIIEVRHGIILWFVPFCRISWAALGPSLGVLEGANSAICHRPLT